MATIKQLFRKVIMVHDQKEIAKVNRKTGVLYLDSKIWDSLPANEKEFVLWHENGHLQLDTADEFKANAYAVKNFVNAGSFKNDDLGKKIMVMRSILKKADEPTSNLTAELAAGAASGIMQTLSILGVGSKARQAEAEKKAAADISIIQAQSAADILKSNTTTKIVIIAGVLLIVGLVLFFTLKNRK